MKASSIISGSIVLLFCWLGLAHTIMAQPNREERLSILDALGRTLEVPQPVNRLVVLTSDALEVIRALKAEDLVVGVNSGIAKDPLFWPQLKNRPAVGSWRDPNYELIVELNPDLVIAYARHPGQDMEKKLAPLGITVLRLDFYKIRTLEKEVEILGTILGKEKEARQLVRWYREKRGLLEEKLRDVSNYPRVYVESYSKYHTTGPGSGGHEMCVMAGGQNIASHFSIPYPEITPEWVLWENPEVIIKATSTPNCYAMTEPLPLSMTRKEIINRPGWKTTRAVQQGRVYVVASDIWTGPRAIVGLTYMAKWFHPLVFRQLEPRETHEEYLTRFQGLKYHGIYTCPGSAREK